MVGRNNLRSIRGHMITKGDFGDTDMTKTQLQQRIADGLTKEEQDRLVAAAISRKSGSQSKETPKMKGGTSSKRSDWNGYKPSSLSDADIDKLKGETVKVKNPEGKEVEFIRYENLAIEKVQQGKKNTFLVSMFAPDARPSDNPKINYLYQYGSIKVDPGRRHGTSSRIDVFTSKRKAEKVVKEILKARIDFSTAGAKDFDKVRSIFAQVNNKKIEGGQAMPRFLR